MSLKTLVDEINGAIAETKINPEDADPRVRAGVEATVRNAGQRLETLRREYRAEAVKHAVLIAVHGDHCADFGNLANENHKLVHINYTAIADRLEKAVRDRATVRGEFGTQEYFIVLDEMQKIRLEYEILMLPAPKSSFPTHPIHGQPIRTAINNLIDANYGDQFYSAITRMEIGRIALAANFAGKILPVVLTNCRGLVEESMLPRPVETLEIKGEVTATFVKEQVAAIKSKVSGKKKTESETE